MPERYGVVTVDGDRMTRIVEKPTQARGAWVNTGVYSLTPEFHDRARLLADSPGVGIPDILESAAADGSSIQAVKSEALWSDAIYPWDLLRVHAEILAKAPTSVPHGAPYHVEPPVLLGRDVMVGHGTTLAAGTCVGNNVVIGPNSVIENSILYDDVQIGAGSIVRNSVIGAGTRIGARFTALSGATEIHLSDGWHHLPDFGAIVGEDCRIGGAVTLLPGSILGNQVLVSPGKTLQTSAPDASRIL